MSEKDPNDGQSSDNLKAEMNRKIQAIQETNSKLAEQNDNLTQKLDLIMAQLNNQSKSIQESEPAIDMEDLKYSDPDKYIELKLKDVDKRVDQKVNTVIGQQNQKTITIQQLAADYPELGDTKSALSKRAIEIAGKLSSDFMQTPDGIKLAVREAAAELGVLPKKLRIETNSNDEDFAMEDFIAGGGGGRGSDDSRKKPKSKEDLENNTIVVAELMGVNVNDSKVVERMKQYKKRNWNKWK